MSMKYCAAKRKTRVKPDLYQVVTNKLIALLEAGTFPWQRPWNQYGLARNYATGHVYTGINAFLLNFFPSFDVPFYLTYKQAQTLGGQVRKGAKADHEVAAQLNSILFQDLI